MIRFGSETEGEATIVLTKTQARGVCAAVDREDEEVEITLNSSQRSAVQGTDFGFDFTGGQRDLIQAVLDVGLQSFQIRSTEGLTTITMKTEVRNGKTLTVSGEWRDAGRFKASYVEERFENGLHAVGRKKLISLTATIERIEEFASARKSRKKSA